MATLPNESRYLGLLAAINATAIEAPSLGVEEPLLSRIATLVAIGITLPISESR